MGRVGVSDCPGRSFPLFSLSSVTASWEPPDAAAGAITSAATPLHCTLIPDQRSLRPARVFVLLAQGCRLARCSKSAAIRGTDPRGGSPLPSLTCVQVGIGSDLHSDHRRNMMRADCPGSPQEGPAAERVLRAAECRGREEPVGPPGQSADRNFKGLTTSCPTRRHAECLWKM